MPRRIIYIKNPSEGSHFRNIDGGGGGGSKPPKAKTPKPPKPSSNPQWGFGAVGYAGNYTQGQPNWDNWWTSFPNTTQLPEEVFIAGNMPAGEPGYVNIFNGLTPEQFYQQQWDEHTGLGFWFWYFQTLAQGIDPNTGAIQAPLGTEGQNSMSPWGTMGYTDLGPQYYHFGPQYGAQIPTQYWGPANFGSAYQQYLAGLNP